jgi:hypothetical protein
MNKVQLSSNRKRNITSPETLRIQSKQCFTFSFVAIRFPLYSCIAVSAYKFNVITTRMATIHTAVLLFTVCVPSQKKRWKCNGIRTEKQQGLRCLVISGTKYTCLLELLLFMTGRIWFFSTEIRSLGKNKF